MKIFYTYILANKRNGTLYTGVTNNLIRRIHEHKIKIIKGFTSAYQVDQLVYFEEFAHFIEAIAREKRLKSWPRKWKIALIEEKNPTWQDLYYELIG